jgi:SpoVK/Ycf46/Vps4 family AAA+-type ATPase
MNPLELQRAVDDLIQQLLAVWRGIERLFVLIAMEAHARFRRVVEIDEAAFRRGRVVRHILPKGE